MTTGLFLLIIIYLLTLRPAYKFVTLPEHKVETMHILAFLYFFGMTVVGACALIASYQDEIIKFLCYKW